MPASVPFICKPTTPGVPSLWGSYTLGHYSSVLITQVQAPEGLTRFSLYSPESAETIQISPS